MNLEIIIFSVEAAFLLVAVVILLLRVKNLKNHLLYVNSRIDPVRLNYLIGFRNLLIQQEKFEDVEYIDELIKDEYPDINLKEMTVEDMLDLL